MGFTYDKSKSLLARIEQNLEIFKIPQKLERMKEITELISKAYSNNDIQYASSLLVEQNNLKKEIEKWINLRKEAFDITNLSQEAEKMEDENLLSEINKELKAIEDKLNEYEIEKFFDYEIDNSNCFMNIHPGAGGVESCDWAAMLFRMYTRFLDRKGFKYEIVDFLPDDVAGIKDVTIYVQGAFAFGYLKSETGIHRLVRISPFDASKRRHTSFSAVHVIPELKEDNKIIIDPSEIKIETFRSSGKGGQHVNKTESAVRITHIPTGIVVSIQNERSQIQNKELAIKILKSKLYELKQKELKEKQEEVAGEKKNISWGNQIRSYILHPYNSVKDHRTGVETAKTSQVLDGEIDEFINAYIKWAYINRTK
ncbi:MAG: peptide chain release factor 2 [Spirochaetia bacterium]|nr:peptide chain release factor 2 [Spirochaetota bacterium]MCX8097021.1 peptide chain release factor 2 [Spirochaetota bacterium]MDW8111896.1 peptide chain release factor 2 [Spirochaetia bacterium]